MLATPGPPVWAQQGVIISGAPADRKTSQNLVTALNKNTKRRLDVLLWGDSLTAGLARNTGDKLWKAAFKGVDAMPLGMRGSSVEQLAWRIFKGGEMPKRAPKVVVLFIGERWIRRREKAQELY